jgi:uncharacterized repeat protein (TIGR01451 family)
VGGALLFGVVAGYARLVGLPPSSALIAPSLPRIPTELASPLSQDALQAARENAQKAASYRVAATMHQTLAVATSGKAGPLVAPEVTLNADGVVHLPDQTQLTIRATNGAAPSAPVTIIEDQGQTFVEQGGALKPAQSPASVGLATSSTDFLGYLIAAENVQAMPPLHQDGVVYQRYYFDLNSTKVAQYLQDQINGRIQRAIGPNVRAQSAAPAPIRAGQGELWINPQGMPFHEVLDLDVVNPPAGLDGQAHLELTYSDFGQIGPLPRPVQGADGAWRLASSNAPSAASPTALAASPSLGASTGFAFQPEIQGSLDAVTSLSQSPLLGSVAPSALLVLFIASTVALGVVYRRRPIVSRLVSALILVSIVIVPLAQDLQLANFMEPAAQAAPLALASTLASKPAPNAPKDTTPTPTATPVGSSIVAPLPVCGQASATTDANGDGLSAADEACLGTNDLNTDLSQTGGLPAGLKAKGIDVKKSDGTTLHLTANPLVPSSLGDGIPDLVKWPAGTAYNGQTYGVAPSWDWNGNNIPNVWNPDIDGDNVPNNLDLSPFGGTGYASNFTLNIAGGRYQGYEDIEIQVQPQNLDHLLYPGTTLNWPIGTSPAAIQHLLNTYQDSVQFIPMLLVTSNVVPSQSLLSQYNATYTTLSSNSYQLQVPLVPFGDGTNTYGLYGKLTYGPDATGGLPDVTWNASLVWIVQVKTDQYCRDLDQSQQTSAACHDDNQVKTLTTEMASYADTYRVTGLAVTKDSNFEASIYGTPATPTDDGDLMDLEQGLGLLFMQYQSLPDQQAGQSILQDIEKRLENTHLPSDQRFAVPTGDVVLAQDFTAAEQNGGQQAVSSGIQTFLERNYPSSVYNAGGYCSDSSSDLFSCAMLVTAIQEQVGVANLDSFPVSPGSTSIDINLANVSVSTMRSVHLGGYELQNGQWQSISLDQILAVANQRYSGDTLNAAVNGLSRAGLTGLLADDVKFAVFGTYAALVEGLTQTIQEDGQLQVSAVPSSEAAVIDSFLAWSTAPQFTFPQQRTLGVGVPYYLLTGVWTALRQSTASLSASTGSAASMVALIPITPTPAAGGSTATTTEQSTQYKDTTRELAAANPNKTVGGFSLSASATAAQLGYSAYTSACAVNQNLAGCGFFVTAGGNPTTLSTAIDIVFSAYSAVGIAKTVGLAATAEEGKGFAALGEVDKLSKFEKFASVAGLVLAVGIPWLQFGLADNGSLSRAQVNLMVATTVVATIFNLVLFILAFVPFVDIAVALFEIVDTLVNDFTGFSLSGTIIAGITSGFYGAQEMVELSFPNGAFVGASQLVTSGPSGPGSPNVGLLAGDVVTFAATSAVQITSAGSNPFTIDRALQDTSVSDQYVLVVPTPGTGQPAPLQVQNAGSFAGSVSCGYGVQAAGTVLSPYGCTNVTGFTILLKDPDQPTSNGVGVQPAHFQLETHQTGTIPYATCGRYFGLNLTCNENHQSIDTTTSPSDMYLDVFPATIDGVWSWPILNNPLASAHWQNPLTTDTGNTGISDAVKFMVNVDPGASDADQDGLTVGQEVCHWDFQKNTLVGGWDVSLPSGLLAHVCSDPTQAESGLAPFNDAGARSLGISPYAYYNTISLATGMTPTSAPPSGLTGVYVTNGTPISYNLVVANTSDQLVSSALQVCLPGTLASVQAPVWSGDVVPALVSAGTTSCSTSTGSGHLWVWSYGDPSQIPSGLPLPSGLSPSLNLLPGEESNLTLNATLTGATQSGPDKISSILPFNGQSVEQDQLYVVDLDNPVLAITAPLNNFAVSRNTVSTLNLSGTSTDATSWLVDDNLNAVDGQNNPVGSSLDLGTGSSWSTTWQLPASDGRYVLTARAHDVVGNFGASSAVTVVVDSVAPAVTLTLPSGGYVTNGPSGGPITLQGTASDPALASGQAGSGIRDVQISVDGQPWRDGSVSSTSWTYSWQPDPNNSQGQHLIKVRAYDQAGNVSAEVSQTLTVDNLAPTNALSTNYFANSPQVFIGTPIALAGTANDAGRAPAPANPVNLQGTLDLINQATTWLEPAAVADYQTSNPNAPPATLTWLGDVNGDGLADFAVGLPGSSASGGTSTGRVVIVNGKGGGWAVPPASAESLASSPSQFVGVAGAQLGSIVGAVGDVRGDGHDDLVIGDPVNYRAFLIFGQSNPYGQNVVLSAPPTGCSANPTAGQVPCPVNQVMLTLPTGATLRFVAGAGDVNGDGYADLLIGTQSNLYLLLGVANWPATLDVAGSAATTLPLGASDTATGVGDVDGDGYSDFAVTDATGHAFGNGSAVYVFHGRSTIGAGTVFNVATDAYKFTAPSGATVDGRLANVGRVTGTTTNTDVFFGTSAGPTLYFQNGHDTFGNPTWASQLLPNASFTPAPTGFLIGPGDVNADGYNDLLVGNANGDAYLFLGSATPANLLTEAATLTGVAAAAAASYAAGADLNGDGSSDLLLVPAAISQTIRSELSVTPVPPVPVNQLPVAPPILPTPAPSPPPGTTFTGPGGASVPPAGSGSLFVVDSSFCAGCPNNGQTFGVNAFATIQDAINAVTKTGSEILIDPGYYAGFTISGSVDAGLTIAGKVANGVIVDGQGGPTVAHLSNVPGVKLSAMTLRDATTGIRLDQAGVGGQSNQISLDHLAIDNVTTALSLDRQSVASLTQSTLASGAHGPYIQIDPAPGPQNWTDIGLTQRGPISPLTAPVRATGAASYGGKLYELSIGDTYTSFVVYDPTTGLWSPKAAPPLSQFNAWTCPMSMCRDLMSAGDGYLYVLDVNYLWRYSVSGDSWTGWPLPATVGSIPANGLPTNCNCTSVQIAGALLPGSLLVQGSNGSQVAVLAELANAATSSNVDLGVLLFDTSKHTWTLEGFNGADLNLAVGSSATWGSGNGAGSIYLIDKSGLTTITVDSSCGCVSRVVVPSTQNFTVNFGSDLSSVTFDGNNVDAIIGTPNSSGVATYQYATFGVNPVPNQPHGIAFLAPSTIQTAAGSNLPALTSDGNGNVYEIDPQTPIVQPNGSSDGTTVVPLVQLTGAQLVADIGQSTHVIPGQPAPVWNPLPSVPLTAPQSQNSLPRVAPAVLASDGNYYWLQQGTTGLANAVVVLYSYNPSTGVVTALAQPPSAVVNTCTGADSTGSPDWCNDLVADNAGGFFVLTSAYLGRYDSTTNHWTLYNLSDPIFGHHATLVGGGNGDHLTVINQLTSTAGSVEIQTFTVGNSFVPISHVPIICCGGEYPLDLGDGSRARWYSDQLSTNGTGSLVLMNGPTTSTAGLWFFTVQGPSSNHFSGNYIATSPFAAVGSSFSGGALLDAGNNELYVASGSLDRIDTLFVSFDDTCLASNTCRPETSTWTLLTANQFKAALPTVPAVTPPIPPAPAANDVVAAGSTALSGGLLDQFQVGLAKVASTGYLYTPATLSAFNPANGQTTLLAPPPVSLANGCVSTPGACANLVPDGAGGLYLASPNGLGHYDLASNTWSTIPWPATLSTANPSLLVSDGLPQHVTALAVPAGGSASTVDVFDYATATQTWTSTGPYSLAIPAGSAAVWSQEQVTTNGVTGTIYVMLPGTAGFDALPVGQSTGSAAQTLAGPPFESQGIAFTNGTLLENGQGFVYAAAPGPNNQSAYARYNESANVWEALSNLSFGIGPGSSLVTDGSTSYVLGVPTYVAITGATSDGTLYLGAFKGYDRPVAPPLHLTLTQDAIVNTTTSTNPTWLEVGTAPSDPVWQGTGETFDDFGFAFQDDRWVGGASWAPTSLPAAPATLTLASADFANPSANDFRITSGSSLVLSSTEVVGFATPAGDACVVAVAATVPTGCASVFSSIQSAINSGAIRVFVGPGVYHEALTLPTGAQVYGASADLTILEPPVGTTASAFVTANGINGATLSHLTLLGDGKEKGIVASNGATLTVSRAIIEGTTTAVASDGANTDVALVNDDIVHNTNGLDATNASTTDASVVDAQNTVFAYNSGTAFRYTGHNAIPGTTDYNAFFQNGTNSDNGGATGPGPNAHAVFQDPLFVQANAPSLASNNYHVQTGSPLIHAGNTLPTPPGVGTIDIGYVQTGLANFVVDPAFCDPTTGNCPNFGLIWHVDAFQSIQDALNAAAQDAATLGCVTTTCATQFTIGLDPGRYLGPLTVPSYVSIIGSGAEQTVIDGGGTGDVITLNGVTQVTIKGVWVTGAGNGASAIHLKNAANNVTISYAVFSGPAASVPLQNGVFAEQGSNAVVDFATIVGVQGNAVQAQDPNTHVRVSNTILDTVAGTALSASNGGTLDNYADLLFNNGTNASASNGGTLTASRQGLPNLVNQDPKLSPADVSLLPGSPAIDAADPVVVPPVGGGARADLGYREVTAPPLVALFGKSAVSRVVGNAGVGGVSVAVVGPLDATQQAALPGTTAPASDSSSWFTAPLSVPCSSLVNGPCPTTDAWSASYTPNVEGFFRMYGRAQDVLGNQQVITGEMYLGSFFAVDPSHLPVVSLGTVPTQTSEAALVLTGQVTPVQDNGAYTSIAQAAFVVDGVTWPATFANTGTAPVAGQPLSFSAVVPLSDPPTSHTIQAIAIDAAGRQGTSGNPVTVMMLASQSGSVANASLTGPAPGTAVNATTFTVSGWARFNDLEPTNAVTVTVNSSAPITATLGDPAAVLTAWSTTVSVPAGTTSVSLKATAFGGPDPATQITVDVTPPNLQVTSPAAGSLVNQPVLLQGTAADPTGGSGLASVAVSLDSGTTWQAATVNGTGWTYSWTPPAGADGVAYQFEVRALDNAGNQTTVTTTLVADTVAPSPVLLAATSSDYPGGVANGDYFSQPQALNLSWPMPVDGGGPVTVRISVDGNPTGLPSQVVSGTSFAPSLPAGTDYVHVSETDPVGNVTTTNLGPYYVDNLAGSCSTRQAIVQLDGILDLAHAEWPASALVDYDSRPGAPEALYALWSASAFNLGFHGASLSSLGTVWAYLGTGSGGTTTPADPSQASFLKNGTLPFGASSAVQITSPTTGTFWIWSGSGWQPQGTVPFASQNGDLEIQLPLNLAQASGLQLLAFALSSANQPDAVYPTTNPLTGPWTTAYNWASPCTVTAAGTGQPQTRNVQVAIGSSQSAKPQPPGTALGYQVTITNLDPRALVGGQVQLSATSGVTFSGAGSTTLVGLPTINSNASQSVTVNAQLGTLLTGTTAVTTTAAVLLPAIGTNSLAQASISQPVDSVPPVVSVLQPNHPFAPGPQTITGLTSDTGGPGVASVQYRLTGTSTWSSAIGTSAWSAPVSVPGGTAFSLDLQATDSYGLASAITTVSFPVDSSSPTAAFSLPSQILGAGYTIQGSATDGLPGQVAKVEVEVQNDPTGWQTAVGPFPADAAGSQGWQFAWTPPLVNGQTFAFKARATNTAGTVGPETDWQTVLVNATEVDAAASFASPPAVAVPGEPITVTLNLTNAGPNPLTGGLAQLGFSVPVANEAWTCVPSLNSSCGGASGTGVFTSTVTIQASGTLTYTVNAVVDPGARGNLVAQAAISPPNGVPDSNPADNSRQLTIPLAPQADLVVSIAPNPPTNAGDPLTYQIAIFNAGPSLATNVALTTTLAAGLSPVTLPAACSAASASISCTLPTLAPNVTTTLPLTVTLAPDLGQPITTVAQVTASEPDPNPANNAASDTTQVIPNATPTATATPSPTQTHTPTITSTDTPSPTPTQSPTVTSTETSSPTPTATATPSDTTAPSCTLSGMGVNSQGQKYLQITVQDTGSGLQTVLVTASTNASVSIPSITPGTTDPLVVVATKINQAQGAEVALQVGDVAGNVTNCDAAFTALLRQASSAGWQVLSGLGPTEGLVTIVNGNPGLSHVLLIVDGQPVISPTLSNGETRTINVVPLLKGTSNTILLRGIGPTGATANVLVSDGKGGKTANGNQSNGARLIGQVTASSDPGPASATFLLNWLFGPVSP